MQCQREIGGREDGQALDEDVGDGLVLCEMRIELISAGAQGPVSTLSLSGCRWHRIYSRHVSFR